MRDQRPAPRSPDQDAVEEGRRLSPGAVEHDGPDVVGWSSMPPEARATCCLVALHHGLPADRDFMRYDARRRIAMVVVPEQAAPAPDDGEAREARCRVAMSSVRGTLDDVIARIRSTHGHDAERVRRAALAR